MSETLLLTPGDPGWDDARLAWNLAVDQHPAAVALPGCVQDVKAAVDPDDLIHSNHPVPPHHTEKGNRHGTRPPNPSASADDQHANV